MLQRCDLQGLVWELHGFALIPKTQCSVNKTDLPCFPFVFFIVSVFEAVLKCFQRVSAGGSVPLEKIGPQCIHVWDFIERVVASVLVRKQKYGSP